MTRRGGGIRRVLALALALVGGGLGGAAGAGAGAPLRLAVLSDITSVDPADASSSDAAELVGQLFAGLVRLDPETLSPVPALAASWTVGDGGRLYSFVLRPDARWSDGMPITASDVVWALRRNILRTPTGGALAGFRMIAGAEAVIAGRAPPDKLGVRAVSDTHQGVRTIEIRLSGPAPWFPATLALPPLFPLPERAVGKESVVWTGPGRMLVSGPYSIERYRAGNFYGLVANPQYFDADKVATERISFLYVRNPEFVLDLYRNGQLDMVGKRFGVISPPDLIHIENDRKLMAAFSRRPDVGGTFLVFNPARAPADHPLVRKAVAAAIDRAVLVRRVNDNGRPATRLLPPELTRDGTAAAALPLVVPTDLAQAGRWLAEAGFADPQKVPELVIVACEADVPTALAVRSTLVEGLNISVRLERVETVEQRQRAIADGHAHAAIVHWEAAYADGYALLGDGFDPRQPSPPWLRWAKAPLAARYGALLDRSNQESTATLRQAVFVEAERVLLNDYGVVVPLVWDAQATLIHPTVKAILLPMVGQPLSLWRSARAIGP